MRLKSRWKIWVSRGNPGWGVIDKKNPGFEEETRMEEMGRNPDEKRREGLEQASKNHQQTDDQQWNADRGGNQGDGQDQSDDHQDQAQDSEDKTPSKAKDKC
jgi:hypothetical protein